MGPSHYKVNPKFQDEPLISFRVKSLLFHHLLILMLRTPDCLIGTIFFFNAITASGRAHKKLYSHFTQET